LIDIGLIEECRGGNLTNFRKLVGATTPFVFSVAFRMTGDEDQAKDIVQETMVIVWQKLHGIRSAEGYKVWVYRKNQLLDSVSELQTEYKELKKLIQDDPELRKLLEEKLNEKNNAKTKL